MSVEVHEQLAARPVAIASSEPSDRGEVRMDLWGLALVVLGGLLTVAWTGGWIWAALWVHSVVS